MFLLSSLLSLASLVTFASAAEHEVVVGGLKDDGTPNLAFWPNKISAHPGDQVTFRFNVKNHTVTQSSFEEPCAKLVDAHGWATGFDSGFQFVEPGTPAGHLPTFTITVNDTKPIWGYCQQVGAPGAATHCQAGMVFGINAPDSGDNTFEAFQHRATASSAQNADHWTTTTAAYPTATTGYDYNDDYNDYDDKHDYSGYGNGPQTHTIVVGGDAKSVGFVYTPANITANVGDRVVFKFMQKNHTVTQSSFNDPCRKLEATTGVAGFDSDFNPVAADATEFPEFTITVNDTLPIWGYCRQTNHCGFGMVFSINAREGTPNSFDAFQMIAVQKNGTGIVDRFGNLTGAAAASASTSASAFWATYSPPAGYHDNAGNGGSKLTNQDGFGSKAALGDDADDDSAEGLLHKLTSSYAPAILGLLGAALAMLVVLVALAVVILRRLGSQAKGAILPTRTVNPSYKQVPLTMPESRLTDDGKFDYEEPRYDDRS